jgi:ketosteroid isomerase-like protein
LQLDKNNTGTQTKLALIRDLFGKGATKTKAAPSALAESSPAQPGSPVQTAVAAPAKPQPAAPAPMVVAAAPAPIPAVQPAPKPAVPAAPAAKVQPPAPAPDIGAEIQQATRDWAAAWAAKNVKRYLAFYAPEFKTPNGESRAAWEKQRKERISKPKSIKVEIANPKVEIIDATHANISFRQTYNASHFKSANNKTLVWVKTAGGWKIADEQRSN